MIRILSTHNVRLTQALIREFTGLPAMSRDRAFKQARFNDLRDLFFQGRLLSLHWATAYCKEDGTLYRVNGKHSARLMASLPFDQVSHMQIFVERVECDTLDDVANAINSYDSPGSAKSAQDTFMAIAASFPALNGLPDATVTQARGGLVIALEQDFQANKVKRDEKGRLPGLYANFTKWLHDYVSPKTGAFLRKGAVTGAMFHNWNEDVTAASQFWASVRDAKAPGDSPAGRLREFLLTYSIGGDSRHRGGINGKPGVPAEYMHYTCLNVYRAWRDGKKKMGLIGPKTFDAANKTLKAEMLLPKKRNAAKQTSSRAAG